MVAEIVERLNSQIYSFTAANKFATFFYAFMMMKTEPLPIAMRGIILRCILMAEMSAD
jgi:hypothetical protein